MRRCFFLCVANAVFVIFLVGFWFWCFFVFGVFSWLFVGFSGGFGKFYIWIGLYYGFEVNIVAKAAKKTKKKAAKKK